MLYEYSVYDECMKMKFSSNDLYLGHKDLLFSIKAINLEKIVDSYYFLIEAEEFFEKVDNSNWKALIMYLWNSVRDELLRKLPLVYLPIDLSDQYLGLVRLINEGEYLKIDYLSTIDYEGYSLNFNGYKSEDLKIENIIQVSDFYFDSIENIIKQIDENMASL